MAALVSSTVAPSGGCGSVGAGLVAGVLEDLADALERLVEDGRALAHLGLGQLGPADGPLGPVEQVAQAAVEAVLGPVPAILIVVAVPARPVFVALLAAHLPGRLPELLLEVANGAPDLVADLAGQAVDRAG